MSTTDPTTRRDGADKHAACGRAGARTRQAAATSPRNPRKRRRPEHAPKPAVNAGLTLFVTPGQLCGQWLQVVLAEKEIERARIEIVPATESDEDFRLLQPSGETPTLADRTGVVSGAVIIAQYLDERYPHPPLMPAEPAPRAQARMIMAQFVSVLFPAVEALHPRNKLPQLCAQMLRDSAAGFLPRGAGSSAGGHGLCGARYTLPDTAMAVLLASLQERRIALPALGAGFAAYAEGLLERPAVQAGLN